MEKVEKETDGWFLPPMTCIHYPANDLINLYFQYENLKAKSYTTLSRVIMRMIL